MDLMTEMEQSVPHSEQWLKRSIVFIFALTALLVVYDQYRPIRQNPPSTHSILDMLKTTVELYWMREGSLPPNLNSLAKVYPTLFSTIHTNDGWGHPIQYISEQTRFELRSFGPDAQSGTRDDIVVTGGAEHRIQ